MVGDEVEESTGEASGEQPKLTAKTLIQMVEAQGYKCALTGWELTPDVAVIDHKHPLSKGGRHTLNNLQVVHQSVNVAKGVMMQDEFIRMCSDVAFGPLGGQ